MVPLPCVRSTSWGGPGGGRGETAGSPAQATSGNPGGGGPGRAYFFLEVKFGFTGNVTLKSASVRVDVSLRREGLVYVKSQSSDPAQTPSASRQHAVRQTPPGLSIASQRSGDCAAPSDRKQMRCWREAPARANGDREKTLSSCQNRTTQYMKICTGRRHATQQGNTQWKEKVSLWPGTANPTQARGTRAPCPGEDGSLTPTAGGGRAVGQ